MAITSCSRYIMTHTMVPKAKQRKRLVSVHADRMSEGETENRDTDRRVRRQGEETVASGADGVEAGVGGLVIDRSL